MAYREVAVGWRAKALAFNMLDRMPWGDRLYYRLQRHVTRTLPRRLVPTADTARVALRHLDVLRRHGTDLAAVTILELGAGWDLHSALIAWCLGAERQVAVDVRPWARAEAINAVVAHLRRDPPPGHRRLPGAVVAQRTLGPDLLAHYGIRYLAPLDAAATGFPAASIDVVLSTSVLEHVPSAALAPILAETRRVIRPDGLASHTVDWSDHYSHADPAITPYNYLRFGEAAWRWANPAIHHQNRLRAPEHRALFAAAGFRVATEEPWHGKPADLAAVPVHPRFVGHDRADLLALGSHFLLRPA